MPDGGPAGTEPRDDIIRPFILEVPGLRGRLVRLGAIVDEILSRHAYPEPVASLLGEHLALTGALASMLKFDGIFTLQTKGDGPVTMMVADVTTAGGLRGYAEFDGAAVAEMIERQAERPITCNRLLGAGYLAYTVDQGGQSERHQGIVELTGESLADTIHHYFRQSEQLKTVVRLAAHKVGGAWRSAGLLLQQMPESGSATESSEDPPPGSDVEDDWRRALVLMATCREAELIDPGLEADDLLYRLFHEERVRVFNTRSLDVGCRCSRARIETILRSLARDEVTDMKVDGALVMTCQFCNIDFRFDDAALDQIYTT